MVDVVVVEALAELWGRPILEQASYLRNSYPLLYDAAQEKLNALP